MLIWTLSDIHLEFDRGWKFPSPLPRFDVLVVAGDLVPHMERGVRWLLDNLPERDVVFVAGNHESYGADVDRTIQKAKVAAHGTRIRVLENSTARIGDCEFIGARLWTDFDLFGDRQRAMALAAEAMNDYRTIRVNDYQERLRPSHTRARHLESRAFIAAGFAKPADPGTKRVVVTHHACHVGAVRPGRERDLISAAYVSDMEDEIVRWGADLWIHGHTHRTDETLIGRTLIVTNGRGYRGENGSFDPTLVIEI